MESPGGATLVTYLLAKPSACRLQHKRSQKADNSSLQPRLWGYMAGIARNHEFLVLANGGMEDHVHLLIQLPPVLPLAKAVSLLKANSSSWMNEHGMKFAWQKGYGAFSVSASNIAAVKRYIANQQKHHKRRTFEDEFIALLNRHGIPFDPKFVFG